jgi:hypothetical protein
MQMLYNSDSYTVVQLDLPGAGAARGGYEIVDKHARKDIYIEGAVAESFKAGVQALVEQGPSEDALDDFIAGYTLLAQQPLTLH